MVWAARGEKSGLGPRGEVAWSAGAGRVSRKEKREGLGWFLGWAGLLKGLGFLSLFYFFLLSYFKPTKTKTICIQTQI